MVPQIPVDGPDSKVHGVNSALYQARGKEIFSEQVKQQLPLSHHL